MHKQLRAGELRSRIGNLEAGAVSVVMIGALAQVSTKHLFDQCETKANRKRRERRKPRPPETLEASFHSNYVAFGRVGAMLSKNNQPK